MLALRTRRFALIALCLAGCRLAPGLAGGRAWGPPGRTDGPPVEYAHPGASAPASVLLTTMEAELSRAMGHLASRNEYPPYFLGYETIDIHSVRIGGTQGTLTESGERRDRVLDVDVRVGDRHLDNMHPAGAGSDLGAVPSHRGTADLALVDDPEAIRRALWLQTDAAYKTAIERFVQVQANQRISVDDPDGADDFSEESPSVFHGPPAELSIDIPAWQERIRAYSRVFAGQPHIQQSAVTLEASATTRCFATSEGTSLQTGGTHARLTFFGRTTADDGEDLMRFGSVDVSSPAQLPDDAVVTARLRDVVEDLRAMRAAPVTAPYTGPAILEGRAAAVFFHESFGHRVEGHRQRDKGQGQTFARKIGESVMPSFISVIDDPGLAAIGGVELNGAYAFDNEGIPGRLAQLVDRGVLTGYLMSRTPIRGVDRSNGHGRREPGRAVTARQGNLVVSASRTTTPDGLKAMLLAEIKRQGKPYGLRFREIAGGFTLTNRDLPQAFKIRPVMMYRVYPDGREELVRGADFEGTPLTALSKIIAAADDPAVFNGYCGGESGSIPVAAVSPSLLVEQIEISRRRQGDDRPPLLSPPPAAPAAPTGGPSS